MSTLFPTALDNFTNPSGSDATNATVRTHSQQHGDLNDAVKAIQLRLGVDGVFGSHERIGTILSTRPWGAGDHAHRQRLVN